MAGGWLRSAKKKVLAIPAGSTSTCGVTHGALENDRKKVQGKEQDLKKWSENFVTGISESKRNLTKIVANTRQNQDAFPTICISS